MRDPRENPVAGDILVGPGNGRRESRGVKLLTDTIGGEHRVTYVCRRQRRSAHIQDWRAWAKTATVVKKGDQP